MDRLAREPQDEYSKAAFTVAQSHYVQRRLLEEADGLRRHGERLSGEGDIFLEREFHKQITVLEEKSKEAAATAAGAKEFLKSACGSMSPESRTHAKMATLSLARHLDPLATVSAESIGHLFVRTPVFFGSVIKSADGPFTEPFVKMYGSHGKRATPIVPAVTLGDNVWETLDVITDLVAGALEQEPDSVLALIGYLAHPDLHPMAAQHLHQSTSHLWVQAKGLDERGKLRTKRKCALTAHWPVEGITVFNTAYAVLSAEVDISFDHVASPKKNDREPFLEDLANIRVDGKVQRFLDAVDEFFVQHSRLDTHMHLTPHICEVLLDIATRRMTEFRRHEHVLYCHEDPTHGLEENHWQDRRDSANKVCELALNGNRLALELVVERLLFDRHWTIRRAAAAECCDIIGSGPPDRWVVDHFVSVVFSLPLGAQDEKEQLHVQEAAEKALVRWIPKFDQTTRDMVFISIGAFFDGHRLMESRLRPIFQRLHAADSRKEEGEAPTLRKERLKHAQVQSNLLEI